MWRRILTTPKTEIKKNYAFEWGVVENVFHITRNDVLGPRTGLQEHIKPDSYDLNLILCYLRKERLKGQSVKLDVLLTEPVNAHGQFFWNKL